MKKVMLMARDYREFFGGMPPSSNRRGLGRGMGKGFKNIVPTDPIVHRQSAKGIKQPQTCPTELGMMRKSSFKDLIFQRKDMFGEDLFYELNKDSFMGKKGDIIQLVRTSDGVFYKNINTDERGFPVTKKDEKQMLKLLPDRDEDGMPDRFDCQPDDPNYQDDMDVMEIDEFTEKATTPKRSSAKALATRIGKLGASGINYVSNLAKKSRQDKLNFSEEVQNLTDAQLKELAIRDNSGGFLGGSKYENELLRRINAQRRLDERLKNAVKPREPLF